MSTHHFSLVASLMLAVSGGAVAQVQSVQAEPSNSSIAGNCAPVQLSISMTLEAAAIMSSVEMIEAQSARRLSAPTVRGAAGWRHKLASI